MGAPGDEPQGSSGAAPSAQREIDPKLTKGGLKRSTKVQLILFVVITLLGVSYVSAKYVGLAKLVSSSGCTVKAEFPDSGGIFTSAEVTYRGVTVGEVGPLKVIKQGVRVSLDLNDCSSPKIPADAAAVIADRSVVGEQYVDLVPPAGAPKTPKNYLKSGSTIPMSRNSIPTATQELLVNLDRFVNSVDLPALRTTVAELGRAANGRGNDLGRLIDATDKFITAAGRADNLDATIQLIDESSSVLQTQLDQQAPLTVWTHNLNLLAQQLKTSNPDFVHLLDTGPGDISTVTNFINDNKTDLGVTLANLATVGDMLVQHLGGIEEIFELYPALAAGGPTTLHDHAGWLGLVLSTPPPQDCGDPEKGGEGYNGTVRRTPDVTSPMAPNVTVHCTASNTGPQAKQVRGSQHVPGGDPISLSGGGIAYPRTVTDNTLRVGPALPTTATVGDSSWVGLVTASLH
jgi:phospholipid/cholesterol/gamma-HCH transport system substrate-binding protein